MENLDPQPQHHSPLDNLGIELTEQQSRAVIDAVEQRAIEESEDHLPSSQPSPEQQASDWMTWANNLSRTALNQLRTEAGLPPAGDDFDIDDYTGQFYD